MRVGTLDRRPVARPAQTPGPGRRAAGRGARTNSSPLTLQEVRDLAGKTQEQVAAASGVSQIEISRAERRRDHKLSTLRRYVMALGGDLEIWVRLGTKRVRLRGV